MSFEVQSHRAGDESNQNGKTDTRLIALNTLLEPALTSATQSKIVQDLTQVLTAAYGSANVSSNTAASLYLWIWDRDNGTWLFECDAVTTLTVIDGGPQPVKVQISLRQAVA